MHGQKIVLDFISHLSPPIEHWAKKPAKKLPKKVTVHFISGLTGILDMQDPLAVVWARMLDLQRRYDRPAYVEMDPKTRVITRLLIPEAARVMSIDIQGGGDVNVVLNTLQARHYLRRTHADFEAMLAALQQAKNKKERILVTATREDYEIIDVRPVPKSMGPKTTRPRTPPQPDPPVSPERAQELFELMRSKTCACNISCDTSPHCIPFTWPEAGCNTRAHEMCRLMLDEGEDPEKVWIYGGLHADTANLPHCEVWWAWHVAPTLMVRFNGEPPVKYVIDPSLADGPVTVPEWRALQRGNVGVEIVRYSSWEPYNSDWYDYPESEWETRNILDPDFEQTQFDLEMRCNILQQQCINYGPPPYFCPIVRSSHFILDRSNFSENEIQAGLNITIPTEITAAFYIVVDGFMPAQLGITHESFNGIPDIVPTLTITPGIAQMTADPVALDGEYPAYLLRRQRLTWTYKVVFSGLDGFSFAGDNLPVSLSAEITGGSFTVSCNATIYLVKQSSPYEIDGATSWLSTDLRVFQIKTDERKFAVTMQSDPFAFITQVLDNLNSGNTEGETFEDDIPIEQQTSALALYQMDGDKAVYNFAIAKVRYRSLTESVTDVRVFFRLFPWATASVEYDQATDYRRHETANNIVPLLGIENGQLTSIPCFAVPRVDSSITSLTLQEPDEPNKQTLPPDASGSETVRYFGCWLDINQTQPQFLIFPSPVDGPYSSNRISIQDLICGEHQCLVSEIVFDPAPIENGVTPATSDKLAQRNLIIEGERKTVKYDATGFAYFVDGTTTAEIHGVAFVSAAASLNYKYDVLAFFLSWADIIFSGKEGNFDFQYWPGHGMDGDQGASLTLTSANKTLYSGSETVILDRPLIQNPSDFVLPNALKYMCSLGSIDARFDYCELRFHRA